MNESDVIDLRALRDARWGAHADRLADQIVGGLGTPPRQLPAPLQLAFEGAAGRVVIAAVVVILSGIGSVRLWGSHHATPHTVTQLIHGEQAPTAANVYLAMRGYQP